MSQQEWDEAAWLVENPRPFPGVKIKDHTPQQSQAYNRWKSRKAIDRRNSAKAGFDRLGRPIEGLKSGLFDEAGWLALNPRPDGDSRDAAVIRHKANKSHAKKRANQEGYDALGNMLPQEGDWDDSDWLAENPKPFPKIRERDLNPEQLRQRKNWIRRKANANPNNKAGIKARFKKWSADNAAHKKKYQSEYYEGRREEVARKQREYNEQNRAEINAKASAARADKELKTPSYANEEEMQRIYKQAALLFEATGTPYEVDHVIPLRGKKANGLHCHGNLIIMPRNLNRAKHAQIAAGSDPMKFNEIARERIIALNDEALNRQ